MAVVAILIVLSVTLVLLNWYKGRREAFRVLKKNGIVGPEPDFLTGNFRQLLGEKNVPRQGQWLKDFGDVHGYYLGTKPTVVIKDTELLKKIQIKDFQKFHARRTLREVGSIDAHSRYKNMLIFQEGNN